MNLRKSNVLLILLLIACRGPKVVPTTHCDEACSPDPNITLEQLERGACYPGHWDCDAGACVGAVLPVTETCGNKDLDCNGFVGDPPPKACYNVCGALSISNCTNGTWGPCVTHPQEFTQPEICDGIDNNCNGEVDETGCNLVFTLTWDFVDEDLDLHVGIDAGADAGWYENLKDDCYFGDCTPSLPQYNPTWDNGGFNNPHLNNDDIYGTGPEVTTIIAPVSTHPYLVAVHWYDLPGNSISPTGTLKVECGGVVIYRDIHFFPVVAETWYAGSVQADTSDGGLTCVWTSIDVVTDPHPLDGGL